jgi:hypothetical protein
MHPVPAGICALPLIRQRAEELRELRTPAKLTADTEHKYY